MGRTSLSCWFGCLALMTILIGVIQAADSVLTGMTNDEAGWQIYDMTLRQTAGGMLQIE
ncbi:MAG: hypothetical protein VYE04_14895 [Pseudomonadota bacterium]|nr:hypothetical protein [Pseudomonadota bacterium]